MTRISILFVLAVLVVGSFGAAIADCPKSAGKAAVAGNEATGCPKTAAKEALVAIKHAAEASGDKKVMLAYKAAEEAVQKASGDCGGCARSQAAAHKAAVQALQKAADACGCPKAREAVEHAALLAKQVTAPFERTDQAEQVVERVQ